MPHQHIRIACEEPTNERKPRKPPRKNSPEDPRAFGARLKRSMEAAFERDTSAHGYDDRRLIKLKVEAGFRPDDLAAIPGVEVVSQEDKSVVLAFADARGRDMFEQRLTQLARNGVTTRKEIFFALQAFENWTADDRKGAALAKLGAPLAEPFVVDVELWPLAKPADRAALCSAFDDFLQERAADRLDRLDRPSLLLYRVRVTRLGLDALLSHRDVRLVDLPPSYGLETGLLTFDVNQLPPIGQPPDGATTVAVLDSGIAAGHPILAPATGEAEGFVPPERQADDSSGHGTRVAGLALYGDVEACVRGKQFVPELRLLSGRVFDDDGTDATRFVERNVEDAVRYFHDQYDCRVYCLSYGDANKVYDGRHVRGLAYTLDSLSRELGVLFVVPTGNLRTDELPADPRVAYPDYLLNDSARLLDPATALNVLTVGGLSCFEAGASAQRYPNDAGNTSIARNDQPAPFTRSGPSLGSAIKPDLVAHAGNLATRRDGGGLDDRRLGVLSTGKDFASGHPFNEGVGTSYAAPQVAHLAAKLLNHMRHAGPNLLRAMLGAHASWPSATADLFRDRAGKLDITALTRLAGYGRIAQNALFESLDNAVSLYAEDALPNEHHHFYELPIPADLWTPGRRSRVISVALAYSPDVRTTRIDYRATQLSFRLVRGRSLTDVSAWYRKSREDGTDKVDEYGNGRKVTALLRNRGTLQCSTWTFATARGGKSKWFVVVTRHDANWSEMKETPEPYALAVTIQDRENAGAQLYAQIQQQIQQRAQVRLRARVRT